jgi:hypothetical protein
MSEGRTIVAAILVGSEPSVNGSVCEAAKQATTINSGCKVYH